MRYYLMFVVFGLLMGSLCVLLEEWMAPPPVAVFGLFGASADRPSEAGRPA